jgi:SAM-dependent methyltransferase
MHIDDQPPPYQAFVRDVVGRFGFDPATFHLEIPDQDEPFFASVIPGYPGRPGAAFFRYFLSALRTYEIYRQLAEALGGFSALGRVLDFGAGHGRLTRSLVHRLDRRAIWACDIYPEAVAWQAETFGVNGLVSVTDPDRFGLADRHGIVFAASVFSHLPDGLFQRWLARLYGLVAPKGLLAFSVHDASFAPADQAIGADGIGYARTSESDTLDPAIYGMSYVQEGYVAQAIAQACGPAAGGAYRRFPRALFENQDLYVVGGPETDLSSLRVVPSPMGGFRPLPDPGGLWSGWGFEPTHGAQVLDAELFIGEAKLAAVRAAPGEPEIAKYFPGAPNAPVRWSFQPLDCPPGSILRVELTSTTGAKTFCYAAAPGPDGPAARG